MTFNFLIPRLLVCHYLILNFRNAGPIRSQYMFSGVEKGCIENEWVKSTVVCTAVFLFQAIDVFFPTYVFAIIPNDTHNPYLLLQQFLSFESCFQEISHLLLSINRLFKRSFS